MSVRYIGHWGDDNAPLEAARMSTGNPTGVDFHKDIKLRQYLWDNDHHSPFEFSTLIVEVECPIFVARQWMRHRTFSYNEFSGRYAEMALGFWNPQDWRGQGAGNKQAGSGELDRDVLAEVDADYRFAIRTCERIYRKLLDLGVCREQARAVLPVAAMTKFRVTGNLRNWIHFLRLRLDPHAQKEIRDDAEHVARIIQQYWPLTYQAARLPILWGDQKHEERPVVQPVLPEGHEPPAGNTGL